MKIGKILRTQQPNIYKELNDKPVKKKKERKEHLSFNAFKSMMEEGSVYRRAKGGSYRQVRHK